jgi:hypothetical protein
MPTRRMGQTVPRRLCFVLTPKLLLALQNATSARDVLYQLIRVFKTDRETGAGAILASVQREAEAARTYNKPITTWTGSESAAAKEPTAHQGSLFESKVMHPCSGLSG